MVRGSNPGGGARFSAPVQAGPGAHPAFCTMGSGSFPGIRSGRGVTLTPHPLLVPWSWKGRAIPLLLLWTVRPVQSLSACTRVHFSFYGIPRKLAGLFRMTLKMQGSANKFWNCCRNDAWWRIIHSPIQSLCGEGYREYENKFKGKSIPLQAWTGSEVSRSLRLPDFKTIGTWRW